MPTIDKAGKPTILTESDQVLNDLKSELAHLKSRMSSIEQEQEQNRVLVERLSFQEELANEAISSHHKEVRVNRENYQVIASVINHLKSPVSSVVSNLSGVIAEIDDKDTKRTLEECMNTAANVLHSFDDVEDFCLTASGETNTNRVAVNIREFFRDILSVYQTSKTYKKMDFRLLVDKQVPENSALHMETIKACLDNLVNEIQQFKETAKATIRISCEKQNEKYGLEIEDLTISIDWDGTSPIKWEESWLASIQSNHGNLVNSGFNLLNTREIVRKTGGHLEIISSRKKISGFKLLLPLTY